MSAPHPMHDPEAYALWFEINTCQSCDGIGEDYIEDDWNEQTQEYGKTWICTRCGGTGIDPSVCDEYDPEDEAGF